jgi:hypothetical protein
MQISRTEHITMLKRNGFTDEQTLYIIMQRDNYLHAVKDEHYSDDAFEDDMWYAMNRSGLFEGVNWSPYHTRRWITFK